MPPRAGLLPLLRAACNRSPRHCFAGHMHRRPDESLLEDPRWVQASKQASKFLLFDRKHRCFARNGAPAWIEYDKLPSSSEGTSILLAADFDSEGWLFALEANEPALGGGGGSFSNLRSLVGSSGEFEAETLALAGQARNLLHWHARTRFCGSCGGSTSPQKAGWKRQCGECGSELFPRTDAVVIMVRPLSVLFLVLLFDAHCTQAIVSADGERVLLGRQPSWPEHRYSCLAGFVDPGEVRSMEGATRKVSCIWKLHLPTSSFPFFCSLWRRRCDER